MRSQQTLAFSSTAWMERIRSDSLRRWDRYKFSPASSAAKKLPWLGSVTIAHGSLLSVVFPATSASSQPRFLSRLGVRFNQIENWTSGGQQQKKRTKRRRRN